MSFRNFYRKTILAAVLLLTVGLTASAQTEYFIDALRSYQRGDVEGARTFFEKEIAQNPDNDAAYYYLYTIYVTKNIDKAENLLKKSIELAPDNYWYKYNLAIFYSHTDRNELAVPVLEGLMADYPKKNDLYFDVVSLYISQNEIDKALETLDRIEKIRGKNEVIAMTRLELLSKRPNADMDSIYRSLADYFEGCKTPRIACVLGDYYFRAYQDSLAIKYYDEAIALDENYSPAYYGKAQVCQITRKYDQFFNNITHFIKDSNINPQAKAEYLKSLMENPQFVRTFANDIDTLMLDARIAHPTDSTIATMLSSYYYSTGRSYYSAELLKQNADLYPESFTAAFQHLVLLYYEKLWPAVQEYSTEYLLRFPSNVDILQMRGIASSQMNQIPQAIEDYQAILAQKPRDTTILLGTYSTLGDLYDMVKDSKKSYQYYEKALKINPDHNPTLNNYAYHMCLEGKNLKKARQMSKKTIESEPDNPTYLDTYAWILHMMGDDLEAKAIFKHAMLYGGKDNAEILDHYADVLDVLGEHDLAKIYKNQAKAMNR